MALLRRITRAPGLAAMAQSYNRVSTTATRTVARRSLSIGSAHMANRVLVNGREYRLAQDARVAVVCLDGSAQEYWDVAIAKGMAPNAERMFLGSDGGSAHLVDCVVPSFTNPNNMSIVTGAPPAVHGISGNFYLTEDGEEIMMNDASLLRCGTILAAASQLGARVITVTAKNKLLGLLSRELAPDAVSLSSEFAASEETAAMLSASGLGVDSVFELMEDGAMGSGPEGGFAGDVPDIYSGDVSVYAMEAGQRLVARELANQASTGRVRPIVAYLSTSDYIQHKNRPDEDGALEFYRGVDGVLGRLDALGCTVVLTADHGMNDKHEGGAAKVLYVQSTVDEACGAEAARVILPITDPYVVHHGALGGYATVYVKDKAAVAEVARAIRDAPGGHVDDVLDRDAAVERFGLPGDRVGDLVVLATAGSVLGRRRQDHDLSQVHNLRSHGSAYEQAVPMLLSKPLVKGTCDKDAVDRLLAGTGRNFDAFSLALNHMAV